MKTVAQQRQEYLECFEFIDAEYTAFTAEAQRLATALEWLLTTKHKAATAEAQLKLDTQLEWRKANRGQRNLLANEYGEWLDEVYGLAADHLYQAT